MATQASSVAKAMGLSKEHQQKYDRAYDTVNRKSGNKDQVTANACLGLFKLSGLSTKQIRIIWDLADGKKAGFIGRDGFYLLLRLIALGQNGKPLTYNSLKHNQDVPLPDWSRQQQNSNSTPKGQGTVDDKLNKMWAPDPKLFQNYAAFFKKVDTDNDGFITGTEIAKVFASRLDNQTLGKVCQMSDIDGDRRFNSTEFAIAMHLAVGIAQKKLPVPPHLPPILNPNFAKKERNKEEPVKSSAQPSENILTTPVSKSEDPLMTSSSNSADLLMPSSSNSEDLLGTSKTLNLETETKTKETLNLETKTATAASTSTLDTGLNMDLSSPGDNINNIGGSFGGLPELPTMEEDQDDIFGDLGIGGNEPSPSLDLVPTDPQLENNEALDLNSASSKPEQISDVQATEPQTNAGDFLMGGFDDDDINLGMDDSKNPENQIIGMDDSGDLNNESLNENNFGDMFSNNEATPVQSQEAPVVETEIENSPNNEVHPFGLPQSTPQQDHVTQEQPDEEADIEITAMEQIQDQIEQFKKSETNLARQIVEKLNKFKSAMSLKKEYTVILQEKAALCKKEEERSNGLKAQLHQAQKLFTQAELGFQRKGDEIDTIKEKQNQLRMLVEERKSVQDQAQQQAELIDLQLEQQREKLQQYQETKMNHENLLQQKKDKLEQYNSEKKEVQDMLAQAKTELAQMKKISNDLKKTNTQTSRSKKKLQKEVDDMTAAAEEAKQDLDKKKEKAEMLASEISQEEQNLDEIKADLEACQRERKETEQQIAAAPTITAEDIRQLEKEIAELRKASSRLFGLEEPIDIVPVMKEKRDSVTVPAKEKPRPTHIVDPDRRKTLMEIKGAFDFDMGKLNDIDLGGIDLGGIDMEGIDLEGIDNMDDTFNMETDGTFNISEDPREEKSASEEEHEGQEGVVPTSVENDTTDMVEGEEGSKDKKKKKKKHKKHKKHKNKKPVESWDDFG